MLCPSTPWLAGHPPHAGCLSLQTCCSVSCCFSLPSFCHSSSCHSKLLQLSCDIPHRQGSTFFVTSLHLFHLFVTSLHLFHLFVTLHLFHLLVTLHLFHHFCQLLHLFHLDHHLPAVFGNAHRKEYPQESNRRVTNFPPSSNGKEALLHQQQYPNNPEATPRVRDSFSPSHVAFSLGLLFTLRVGRDTAGAFASSGTLIETLASPLDDSHRESPGTHIPGHRRTTFGLSNPPVCCYHV